MNREEELFQKRLIDLANLADRRCIVTYTDFLNLNELNIYHQTARELSFVKCISSGGFEYAERQIAAFVPDALFYEETPDFPISCIHITPKNAKYADDLTHRDFLGAVLNLGIDRGAIGDILTQDSSAWIFCKNGIESFVCRELTQVKHTYIRAEAVQPGSVNYQPRMERIHGSVASVRLDSLLALAFGGSRSSLNGLVEGGRVFVNARLVTSNGYKLKENDLISARGLGKFRYLGISGGTRKGRLVVEIEKYG